MLNLSRIEDIELRSKIGRGKISINFVYSLEGG